MCSSAALAPENTSPPMKCVTCPSRRLPNRTHFSAPEERIKGIESVLTMVGGKVVHATSEFATHAPPPIPVLPEWSPVKYFGGYGAPLDVRKAARAGVPIEQHQHNADRHSHGCAHAAHQLLAGINTARNRYTDFFGLGCDCFAF